jgi:hypothetical protein
VTNGTLLVTVLGTNPKPARYTLHESSVEAVLAPLALVHLLSEDRRPSRILALCTSAAKEQSWPILERGLAGGGINAEIVEIEADPTDVTSFLRTVTNALPAGSAPQGLMIDATHGYRHYALLTYLTIQYLSALRDIELRGAFYGLWRPVDEGTSPFLDLRALLVLPEWIHALRVFGDAGDASGLARLVERGGDQAARAMAKELRRISEAREAGLPLELGQTSASFRAERRKPFKKALAAQGALLEDELWRRLDEPLVKFGLAAAPNQSQGWKKQVALSAAELKRQAALVDDLLERGSIAVALGLMNEWTVSRVVLQMGNQGSWLDYHSARRAAATVLGALDELARDPSLASDLTQDQRELGRFWLNLSDLRNAFHHHGMRPQVLVGTQANDVESKLDALRAYWDTLKATVDLPVPVQATTRRLLVSPVGRRPGVLYSAIDACRRDGVIPDACLVLVSDETSSAADEALRAAEFDGQVCRIRMADPYGGQAEIEALVREARSHLVVAQEIAVNLTGGTTLMGLAVAAIANEAQRLARDVRRFGLVDRRPPNEQDADPYRTGEVFWLDPRSGDGD